MKTIAFVDQYATIGGGQRSLIGLIHVCRQARANVTVFAPGGGAFESVVRDTFGDGVDFRSIPEMKLGMGKKSVADVFRFMILTVSLVPRLWALRKFPVVCVNGPRLYLLVGFVTLFSKARCFYYVRLDHKPTEKWLLKLVSSWKGGDRVIANSDFTGERLRRFGIVEPLIVINNAIYPPYDSLPFTNRFAEVMSSWNVAIHGRVSPEKGHDILPSLVERFPNFTFHILGECRSENMNYLRGILKQGQGRIIHHGYIADISNAFAELNIHFALVPSRWEEPFGLAAVEAMAMSCITVVSKRGMLAEIAKATGCFSFSSEEECFGIFRNLAITPVEILCQMAEQAHSKVLEIYSFNRFREKIENIFFQDSPKSDIVQSLI